MIWGRDDTGQARLKKFVSLIFVAIFALGVAWYFLTARKREALREIKALNGLANSTYRIGTPVNGFEILYGPIDRIYYFLGPKLDDRRLEVLDNFPDLRILTLSNTRITDAGLASLARFRELNTVCVGNQDYTKLIGPTGADLATEPLAGGRGLEALKDLPKLHTVQLIGPGTSDDDLAGLGTLKQLKMLDFLGTKVTKEGLARLRKDLPRCAITQR